MQTEIKITADGSATLYVPELNEHYHSTHGAVQESEHVFIQMGLHYCSKQHIKLLEIGFGTGLNALLTLVHLPENSYVNYTSIEKNPLPWKKVEKMRYSEKLQLSSDCAGRFKDMHTGRWSKKVNINDRMTLIKKEASLLEFETNEYFDLVYFDAFAPEKQPELWEEEVFLKMYACMNNEGILVTYCAKGEVRRRMQRAGFKVERLPGPPGKREMLRGTKNT